MPREDTQFKPGNPGRPKGSRNKLSEAFIKALADDFREHGHDAIEAVRANKPESYLGVIGRLMPKLLELSGPDGSDIPLSGTLKGVSAKRD
jgi:hypothetical protein